MSLSLGSSDELIWNAARTSFTRKTTYTVYNSATGQSARFDTYDQAAAYMNSNGGSAASAAEIQNLARGPGAVNAVYLDGQQVNLQTGRAEQQIVQDQNQANATGFNPGTVSANTVPQPTAADTEVNNFQATANTDGYGSQNDFAPAESEIVTSDLISVPPGADPELPTDQEGLVRLNDGANLGVPDEFGFVQSSTGLNVLPEDQEPGIPDGYLVEFGAEGDTVLNPEEVSLAQEQAEGEFNARQRARQQQAIASQRRQVNNADWRVRLRLAPQSKYLYNAPQPGILQPLTVTDGVIFPYTPTITTAYRANYSTYDLTHSNYKGYFYGSSNVDPVTVTGMFTAQDTAEANYLLAVIHFFRSATKMFYGQDAERGSPPPLVYLTGLGEYQFNEHSCLIQNFNYTLPSDVDYIRAGSPGDVGINLTTRRDRQNVATNGIFGSLNRLAAAFLSKGAIPGPPAPPTLGLNRVTYVPTKMEISVTLLPVQSRQQVSKQFSVKEFANGNLLRGGFW